MEKEDKTYFSVNCLPDELISIILQNNSSREILNFGATCKRFNNLIRSHQYLWKAKFKHTLPSDVFKIVDDHGNGEWLHELQSFHKLKKQLYNEIISMSPKYYWCDSKITLEDIRIFFNIVLNKNWNYYYTVYILQDLIKNVNRNLEKYRSHQPFTLTEMHYAKVVLRYLIHSYLALKWVKAHKCNELSPEIVINFFLQWIDTDNLHLDENVEYKIQVLVKAVEEILRCRHSCKRISFNMHDRRIVSERQVLSAVTEAIFSPRNLAVTATANLDTLNIIKVLNNRCGSPIAVAAIYQAVATRCGISNCELIAFPNHLFLEWRDETETGNPQVYNVDLATGELIRRRRCPFSHYTQNNNVKYCPDSFLQYIYSSFHMSMGAIRNWNTQNAHHLLDFLGTNHVEDNPYRNFLPFLLDNTHAAVLSAPLDIKYLNDVHIEMIRLLSTLNRSTQCPSRKTSVKRHESHVKFAVGMICYHKKYDYICIIRGWDAICAPELQRRLVVEGLYFGFQQPFYKVVAVDQSERYVAQENLREITRPTRLYHLEDMIAREFTHFDGFAYVPNDQKTIEYPDETPIVSMFRNHAELKTTMGS